MKRSYPDDLVIGNLSRRGFLKGVGATGVLLVALLAWFLTRGYGEVCPQTYEFSKAL